MSYEPIITVFVFHDSDWSLLKRTLWSLEQQIFRHFEIIILSQGDDSSTTTEFLKFCNSSRRKITYSFAKAEKESSVTLFNDQLKQLTTDYIFTTRSGCILREDVLQSHYERRCKGRFLSGGSYKIGRSLFNRINQADIATQRSFNKSWLLKNGLKSSFENQKLTTHFVSIRLMELLTPRVPVWKLENSSGWLADIMEVKGMDTRYFQEGFDLDLGIRLVNNGVKPLQIRYSAMALTPDTEEVHAIDQESTERNRILLEELYRTRSATTSHGISS